MSKRRASEADTTGEVAEKKQRGSDSSAAIARSSPSPSPSDAAAGNGAGSVAASSPNAGSSSNTATGASSSSPVPGDSSTVPAAIAAAPPPDPHAIPPSPLFLSCHDMAPQLRVRDGGLVAAGHKGYCSIRASHALSEGALYFELRMLPSQPVRIAGKTAAPAVRVGVCSDAADLHAPVGYDVHGYSLRSTDGCIMHNARPQSYARTGFGVGDVVGVWIVLPPDNAALFEEGAPGEGEAAATGGGGNKKKSSKKKAASGAAAAAAAAAAANSHAAPIAPLPADSSLSPAPAASTRQLVKSDVALLQHRTFHKRSFLRFFLNGEPAYDAALHPSPDAFTDLLRDRYYPAVSLYMGATVELNFGPTFWKAPAQVVGGVAVQLERQRSMLEAAAAGQGLPTPHAALTPSVSPPPLPSQQHAQHSSATSVSANSQALAPASASDAMSDVQPSADGAAPSVSSTSSAPSSSPPPPAPVPSVFRLPLSKSLLTSGLFPQVDGSGCAMHPNPRHAAAVAAAAEEARLKAQAAQAEMMKKVGLGAQIQPTHEAATAGKAATKS